MGKWKKPIPLVKPAMKSLKRARHVTSEFHRLTHAIESLEKLEAAVAAPGSSCGSGGKGRNGYGKRFLEDSGDGSIAVERAAVAAATVAGTAMSKQAKKLREANEATAEAEAKAGGRGSGSGGACVGGGERGGGGLGSERAAALGALRRELAVLGGREAYQQASVVATSRQSSTKWVVKSLRRRGILRQPTSGANCSSSSQVVASTTAAPCTADEVGEVEETDESGSYADDDKGADNSKDKDEDEDDDEKEETGDEEEEEYEGGASADKVDEGSGDEQQRGVAGASPSSRGVAAMPSVLEVGAINNELLVTKGLKVRAIDLLARFPGCEQRDVFDLATEAPLPAYDAIVASMVINCIPTPLDRGRFLVLLKRLLLPGGLLYLTLPRSCLTAKAAKASKAPRKEGKGKGRQQGHQQRARAAPGFDFSAFEAMLRDQLRFVILPAPDSKDIGVDKRSTAKVAFYCLQKPLHHIVATESGGGIMAAPHNNAADALGKRKKDKGGNRGKGGGMSVDPFAFAVVLPEGF